MHSDLNKILIIRTDRLGDCILSVPAAAALKAINKNAVIDVLTTPYTSPVFTGNPDIREVIIDDPSKYSIFSGEYRALIKRLAEKQYDICFILHITARASLTAFMAGIKRRVSPASKIYQFLSTDRVVQKRSLCRMNEAEYNLDLIRRPLGVDFKNPPARLYFDEDAAAFARNYLNDAFMRLRGRNFGEFKESGGKLILVHPGCGGSAVNMSPAKYAKLIETLRGEGYEVFLSTGPAEEALKKNILSKLKFTPLHFSDEIIRSGVTLKNTLALISECDAAVAPSTGIMHAAVALEKPVVTLFCPIFVCAPVRWGPYMPVAAEIITPDAISSVESNIINQKYCIKCVGSECSHYNCMDRIEIKDIADKLRGVIAKVSK